jgi:predicted NBD/HSP70 family sugar kinase
MRGSTHIQTMRLLRQNGGMSRADLARQLHMNNGTMSRTVAPLIKAGWVKEKQKVRKPLQRGKLPTQLELNTNAFFSIGVAVTQVVDFIVLDLKGNVKSATRRPNIFPEMPENAITDICNTVKKLADETQGTILGICLVTAGALDAESKQFSNTELLGKKENSELLINALKNLNLGILVFDKIETTWTLAELQTRSYRNSSPTFFGITEGLEFSAVINGKMLSSPYIAASRLSHSKVPGSNEQCAICGQLGCLCMTSALWAMQDIAAGYTPGNRKFLGYSYQDVTEDLEKLFELMKNDDVRLRPIVRKASEALAKVIENIAIVLHPEVIYLHPWLNYMPELGIDLIRKHLQHSFSAQNLPVPLIETATYGDYQGAAGAAMLVIEKFFGNEIPPHLRVGQLSKPQG